VKFPSLQTGYESVFQPVGWAKRSSLSNNFHGVFLELTGLKSNLCHLS